MPTDEFRQASAVALQHAYAIAEAFGPVPPGFEFQVRFRRYGASRWGVLPVSGDTPETTHQPPKPKRKAKASAPLRTRILALLTSAKENTLSLRAFCLRLSPNHTLKGTLQVTVAAMELEGEIERRPDGSGRKLIRLTAAYLAELRSTSESLAA